MTSNESTLRDPPSREAVEALTRIGSHEQECARRYVEITAALTRLHERIDGFGRVNTSLLVAIATAAMIEAVRLAIAFVRP